MRGFCHIPLVGACVVFLLAASCYGGGVVEVSWTPHEVGQGEVLLVVVTPEVDVSSIEADFDGVPLFFYERDKEGRAGIVGVDMAASPGFRPLRVQVTDRAGRVSERVFQIQVHKVEFAVQRLTLPKKMVDLKGEILERYRKEHRRIKGIFNQARPERLWRNPFVKPVDGPITGAFGLCRILNNRPRSPHSGVDIAAIEGTPVGSCNDGVVALAQELYLEGKTIIIDHGYGLYSIYMHLSEMQVREGQWVRGGEVIGLVGATGRVTGAHLHWGVRLLGARIDPFSLLRLFPAQECE